MNMSNYYDIDDVVDIKVVVVGSNTVGKTSAVRAFSGHSFLSSHEYQETKDVLTTAIQLKGNDPIVSATFWDCSPQTFLQSPHEILHDAACIILAYDVCNYNSFLEATKLWSNVIKPNLKQDNRLLFIMLLGCKTDLATNRTVSIKEAEVFASKNSIFFMEISAKIGTNIDLTLTLLRIRSLNALSSEDSKNNGYTGNDNNNSSSNSNSNNNNNNAGAFVPSLVGGQIQSFMPPPPPPSPPSSESNSNAVANDEAVENKLVDSLSSQGVRLKSPKRQFGLSAQISSSYETINSILGRQQEQQKQKEQQYQVQPQPVGYNNISSGAILNKDNGVKSPKEQVYMNLMRGRRSQYNVVQNQNTPTKTLSKLETKEGGLMSSSNGDVAKKSPVFEQEYEVLRGMFDEFDATTQQTLKNNSIRPNSPTSSAISNTLKNNINNNIVRVYMGKSPKKNVEFDNKFGRGMGPKLDSYDAIDSPQVARQATGISSSKTLHMPNSSTSPASIPLLNASQKIKVRDSGLGKRPGTFNNSIYSNNGQPTNATDKMNNSGAYGNILAKAYGQNLMHGSKNTISRQDAGKRWNDNNVVKVSPRKLKAVVVRQERNKQIPLWNQHVVKKKFGPDSEKEVKTKRKKKIGYLPKQYQRYRRPRQVEKPTTPPDLVVDVTLPNGRSGTIEVRAGDNARDLAEIYVYEHSLRMRFIPILTDLIEEKVKEFLVLEERKFYAQKRRQARNSILANQSLERRAKSPRGLNNSGGSSDFGSLPSPNLTVPQPFYLETAERGRSTYKSPPKRIIAKLHIDVGPSKRGTIIIRLGDSAEKLVNEFRRTYRIQSSQCNIILKRVQKLMDDAKRQEELDRSHAMNESAYSTHGSSMTSYSNQQKDSNPISNSPNGRNTMMESPSYGSGSPERALTPAQNELLRRTLGFGVHEHQQSQLTREIAQNDKHNKNLGLSNVIANSKQNNTNNNAGGTTTETETDYGTTTENEPGYRTTTENETEYATDYGDYTTDNGTGDEDAETSHDDTDHERKEEQQAKPVFNLDINLPGKQSKRITVYEGNDPKELAKDFVRQNGLPESSIDRLTNLLISGLEKHQKSEA
jgi:small GTP-binding protein